MFPKDMRASTGIGEFHNMCTNEDGSIVVFGSDTAGDSPWTIMYSNDSLNTVRRATVQNPRDVVPNVGEYDKCTVGQFRSICYNSKHKIFIATTVVNFTQSSSTAGQKRAMCVWTSQTGNHWTCKHLRTASYIQFADRQFAIAYDDEADVVVIAAGHYLYWTQDCQTWNELYVSSPDEAGLFMAAVLKIGKGKFAIWLQSDRNIQDVGILEATFAAGKMTVNKVVRLSAEDQTDLNDKCKAAGITNVDLSFLPAAAAYSNGHCYAGLFAGAGVTVVGGYHYDIANGILKPMPPLVNGNKMSRGAVVDSDGNIWFLVRTNYLAKIIPGEETFTEYETGASGKFEGGCTINGISYICGRSGSVGLVFTLDPANATVQPVSFNMQDVQDYISRYDMSQITKLSSNVTDISTIVAKINKIIELGNIKYGQGLTWWSN